MPCCMALMLFLMLKISYYSRANAPTGSAGEESVSSCWVAVAGFWWLLLLLLLLLWLWLWLWLLLLLLLLLLWLWLLLLLLLLLLLSLLRAARERARQRQTRPQKLTHLARARARGASPHICEKKGAHKLSQNHGIYDVFAASERENKNLKIRIACILRCFVPVRTVGCESSRAEKCLKHRNLQCFLLPSKDKTSLFTMFSFSCNPKIEPKHRYLRCFIATAKKVFLENAGKQKLT